MNKPTFFDCTAVFVRLNDYLDRELTEDEVALVKVHLERCRVCAMEYKFEASLLEQIRHKACQGQAPPELRAAVKALCAQAKSEG